MATKKKEEIKGKTKQKMEIQHNKERENHLEQESNKVLDRRQWMALTDGGLHPTVDGQSLGEMWKKWCGQVAMFYKH